MHTINKPWPRTGISGAKRANIVLVDESIMSADWWVGHGKDESCQFEGTWWDMICFARNVLASENTRLAAPEFYHPEMKNDNYTGPTPYEYVEESNAKTSGPTAESVSKPNVDGSAASPCSTACANCNGDRWIECDSSHGMPPGVGYPCADCNPRGELKYREPMPSNARGLRAGATDAAAPQPTVAGSDNTDLFDGCG